VEVFMKKAYVKPSVESESVFETLAAGCTLLDPKTQPECDPKFGGVVNLST
jgi:hypothetical protein